MSTTDKEMFGWLIAFVIFLSVWSVGLTLALSHCISLLNVVGDALKEIMESVKKENDKP